MVALGPVEFRMKLGSVGNRTFFCRGHRLETTSNLSQTTVVDELRDSQTQDRILQICCNSIRVRFKNVCLFGHHIGKEPAAAKRTFGYISDGPLGYDFLSGSEFLALAASLKGLSKKEAESHIRDLTKLFPIAEVLPQSMAHYSRGSLQKVAFLAALLAGPQILIIDEPVVGLDPGSITAFGEKIKAFAAAGGLVFFVTHTLSFGEKYATRYGLLKAGVLVAEGKITPRLNLESLYHQHVGYD